MSAARARGQAGNGRGEQSYCSLNARVLCVEHVGEKVSGLLAQRTVMYCKAVDLACGFGLLRLWEKLGLMEVPRCPAVLSSTAPQLTTALWSGLLHAGLQLLYGQSKITLSSCLQEV